MTDPFEDFYHKTGQKPFKETARARSIHEMHFAASLDPCPSCGTRIDAQQLSFAGGDESWALTGNCPRCGTPRAFTFLTYGDPLKAPCPRDELAGPKPSEIIPPSQWIAEIDRLLPLLRHDPTTLGYEEWTFNRDTNKRLLVCVNELLKFVPAGVSGIPVSSLSGEERADHSARPERYRRAWLEERRAQCLRLREKNTADLPRIEKLQSTSKGHGRARNRKVEFDHDALRAHEKWLAAGRRGRGRLILDGASGLGLRFPAAELTGAKLEDVDLSDCDFRFATFDEAKLRDVRLVGAYLESASFAGAQIKKGSFVRARLVLANLADATVEGTTFDGADLDRTLWHGARVVQTDFERATFGNAQLDGATFLRCRFRTASFAPLDRLPMPTTSGAMFEDCDLRHTRWDGRDLNGAVFIRCKLYGVAGIPSAANGIMIEAPDLSPNGDGSDIATAEDALAMWFPDRVVGIVPPEREVETLIPCQSNEEELYQHCSICSQLVDYQSGFQKIGREEQDTYLPAAAARLQVVRDLVPNCNGVRQLKQCPECSTYYLYREEYEFLIGGSEDEQQLTRLTSEDAVEYLKSPAQG